MYGTVRQSPCARAFSGAATMATIAVMRARNSLPRGRIEAQLAQDAIVGAHWMSVESQFDQYLPPSLKRPDDDLLARPLRGSWSVSWIDPKRTKRRCTAPVARP